MLRVLSRVLAFTARACVKTTARRCPAVYLCRRAHAAFPGKEKLTSRFAVNIEKTAQFALQCPLKHVVRPRTHQRSACACNPCAPGPGEIPGTSRAARRYGSARPSHLSCPS